MVSSTTPFTPPPQDDPTIPIPEAHITVPLSYSKKSLGVVKEPIEVKLVHGAGEERVVIGRIFVSSSNGEKSDPTSDPEENDKEALKLKLFVEIRWGESEVDAQAADRVKALMDILATPKLPWIEKWEEENVRVMERYVEDQSTSE